MKLSTLLAGCALALVFSTGLARAQAQPSTWGWAGTVTDGDDVDWFHSILDSTGNAYAISPNGIAKYSKTGQRLWQKPLSGSDQLFRGNWIAAKGGKLVLANGVGTGSGFEPQWSVYDTSGAAYGPYTLGQSMIGAGFLKGMQSSQGPLVFVGDSRTDTLRLDGVPKNGLKHRYVYGNYSFYIYSIYPDGSKKAAYVEGLGLTMGDATLDDFGNVYLAAYFYDSVLTVNGTDYSFNNAYRHGFNAKFSLIKLGVDGSLKYLTGQGDRNGLVIRNRPNAFYPSALAVSPDGSKVFCAADVVGKFYVGDSLFSGDSSVMNNQPLYQSDFSTGVVLRFDSAGHLQRSYTIRTHPPANISSQSTIDSYTSGPFKLAMLSDSSLLVCGVFSGTVNMFKPTTTQLLQHVAVQEIDAATLTAKAPALLAGGPTGGRRRILSFYYQQPTGRTVLIAGVDDPSGIGHGAGTYNTAMGFGNTIVTSQMAQVAYMASVAGIPPFKPTPAAVKASVSPPLLLHPNPASEAVQVYNPSLSAQPGTLTDLTGNTVRQETVHPGWQTLSVRGLPPGMYLLRVGSNAPARLSVLR